MVTCVRDAPTVLHYWFSKEASGVTCDVLFSCRSHKWKILLRERYAEDFKILLRERFVGWFTKILTINKSDKEENDRDVPSNSAVLVYSLVKLLLLLHVKNFPAIVHLVLDNDTDSFEHVDMPVGVVVVVD
jgi:hypothetical protein